MPITEALKKWIVENCDVKADATDDEFRKAAGDALVNGKLSAEKLTELSADSKVDEANEFGKKLDAIASGLEKLVELQKPAEKKEEKKKELESKEEKKETKEEKKTTAQPSQFAKMIAGLSNPDAVDPDKSFDVRVREASERYSTTKTALVHPERTKSGKPHSFGGQRVKNYDEHGRFMDTASELDMAVAGAYAKHAIATAQRLGSRRAGFQALPQHDRELLYHAMEKMKWCGFSGHGDDRFADIIDRKLTSLEQKQLIDEAAGSQGQEAVPIVFDDQVIQTPLLHGELFPLVNVVPIDRGRRIEGVSTGTVTGSWGGVDDTDIPLFVTTAYVNAFDTTIFRWEGSVLVGLDFLSDSPINFGAHITQQYGERLLEDLDDVIATGDGATQPLGVVNTAGLAAVAFGGVDATIGNYESLRFGVAKPEHGAMLKTAAFLSNETNYARARAIPVGAADDRRLFGMDHDSYEVLNRPYKINESFADNTNIFYGIFGRYRLYRRRGLTVRTSTEGQTLIRANELLISVTARYGGQLERAAAGVETTTAAA